MDKTIRDFCETYGVERKQTNSVKWDGLSEKFSNDQLLPMWVADMEFKVPKQVEEALMNRVAHGAFGYSLVPDSYYEAFFAWQKRRYGVLLKEEWLRFSTGVVNSFFWIVQGFTQPNEGVMILSPVYYPFYDSVEQTGRRLVVSDLIEKNDRYTMNFSEIEEKIVKEQVKVLIHCSPHNPVGRVWERQELEQLMAICAKHEVLVVADEIHQDLTSHNHPAVAMLSLGEQYHSHLIVLNAPSKTFNLAGLLNSHIIIPDEHNREIYDQYAEKVNKAANSTLGLVAGEACYRYGEEWLSQLMAVIHSNHQYLVQALAAFPKVRVSQREGTYLAWIDLGGYVPASELVKFMEEECQLAVDYGEWFGKGYDTYIRLNLATLPKYVKEGVDRLVTQLAKRQEK